jgi:outer membrane protein TolC
MFAINISIRSIIKLFSIVYICSSNLSYSQNDRERLNNTLSTDIIDKLIQTAWENYPKNKVFQHLIEYANEKVFQEKWSWLNTVNLTWQYAPSTVVDNQRIGITPQFGVGLIINIGNIFSTPSRVAQAEQEKMIAEVNLENQRNYIVAEVMRRYHKYYENMELLNVHSQAADDAELVMNMVKYRFEQGEVNLEDYTRALNLFTSGQENIAKTKGKVISSKYSLEEILGVKLEEVL